MVKYVVLISDYQPSTLTYLIKLDTYTSEFSGYEEYAVKARVVLFIILHSNLVNIY